MHLKMINRMVEFDRVSGRQVTTSFGGIAKMQLRWNELGPQLQTGLTKLIAKVCSSLNDREVGNLLHSISKIGIPWNELPRQVQSDLLQRLIHSAPRLLSQQGSMSIYSLGLTGLVLENTLPAVRDNIYLIAANVLTEAAQIAPTRATSQQVYIVTVLYIFIYVTTFFCQSIMSRNLPISTFLIFAYSAQTSNVIYGLAKLGSQFAECPEQLRRCLLSAILCLLPHMNEQEVANTIYSYALHIDVQHLYLPLFLLLIYVKNNATMLLIIW